MGVLWHNGLRCSQALGEGMAILVFANHLTRTSCVWRPQVKAPALAPITLGAPTGGGGRITPLDLSVSSHRMTRCTANAKLCGDKKNPGGLGFRQDNKALGDVVLAVVGSTIQLPLRQNTTFLLDFGVQSQVQSQESDHCPTTHQRLRQPGLVSAPERPKKRHILTPAHR